MSAVPTCNERLIALANQAIQSFLTSPHILRQMTAELTSRALKPNEAFVTSSNPIAVLEGLHLPQGERVYLEVEVRDDNVYTFGKVIYTGGSSRILRDGERVSLNRQGRVAVFADSKDLEHYLDERIVQEIADQLTRLFADARPKNSRRDHLSSSDRCSRSLAA
jgi:hypothetical protein